MTTCTRCNAELHRDFPDKREHCSGCDRVPAFCRCSPVAARFVPTWKRNLTARDETGRLVAA